MLFSQRAKPQVPLRGAEQPERHTAPHLRVRAVRVLHLQRDCRLAERVRERAEPAGHGDRDRRGRAGRHTAAVHRGRVAPPRAPARARSHQARPPDCNVPADLQHLHVRHLHVRGAEGIRQPGKCGL